MRYWGFEDARARPGGADGGVDVVSRRALGQVKFQASAVGRPELQRLFGARGRAMDKQLLFFTGSTYAATAVAYAEENGIALFVYGLDGAMRPVNRAARRVCETAATPPASAPAATTATPKDVGRAAPGAASAATPRANAGAAGRKLVTALVIMGVLGGLVSALEGLTGYSPVKNDVTSDARASAGPRALDPRAFERYAAAHGSAEQRDAVRHVLRIEHVVSPYTRIDIHTDFARTSGAYAEGRLISGLFSAYRQAEDRNSHGNITVYSADASVPLAYDVY
ncbi:hypothetical protein GCM10020295_04680 [Streptomyces cinereospinus]